MSLTSHTEQLATRIGAGVLVVVVATVVLLLTIGRIELRGTVDIEVYFSHPGALRQGAQVTVAGKTIGEVRSVGLVAASQTRAATHPLNGQSGVVARVRIKERYAHMAPIDAEYFVSTKGIVGIATLEIGAPRSHSREKRTVHNGAQIRGIDPPRFEQIVNTSFRNLKNMRTLVSALEPQIDRFLTSVDNTLTLLSEIEPAPGTYSQMGPQILRLFSEASSLRQKLADSGLTAKHLRAVVDRAEHTFKSIAARVRTLQRHSAPLVRQWKALGNKFPPDLRSKVAHALSNLDSSIAKVNAIIASAQHLEAMMTRGEGTVGGLLNDPEFSDDAKKVGKFIKRRPWLLFGRGTD